jgi:hypothetical protein
MELLIYSADGIEAGMRPRTVVDAREWVAWAQAQSRRHAQKEKTWPMVKAEPSFSVPWVLTNGALALDGLHSAPARHADGREWPAGIVLHPGDVVVAW